MIWIGRSVTLSRQTTYNQEPSLIMRYSAIVMQNLKCVLVSAHFQLLQIRHESHNICVYFTALRTLWISSQIYSIR